MAKEIKKKLIKKFDKLTNLWSITIPVDITKEEIEKQLKNFQLQVNIDGFRKGNAPLDVVEKKYGEDALYRAINVILRKSINEIIDENKYTLAMTPEVTFTKELKKNDENVINVTIVKKPEIPEIKYDKFEFDVYELELSQEDKDKELSDFANKMAKQKLVDDMREVKNGNIVDIDFVGKLDGVEFEGGKAKGYKLEIGSKSFIEGFEEQIIGHKKGDVFDIKVKFPENYHSKELQGKDAVFTITLNDVYIKEKPELNDDFAKTLGFKEMKEIEDLLFSNTKNMYDIQMKQLLKNDIFNSIISKTKFDLPETMIDREIDEKLNQQKEEDKTGKFDEKKVRNELKENIYKSYYSFYLTDNIAEKNAISVSDDDINQAVSQDAIRSGFDVKEALDKIKNDEKMKNYISFTIKESKVYDFIFDNVKKKIKKLNKSQFDEFLENAYKQRNKEHK